MTRRLKSSGFILRNFSNCSILCSLSTLNASNNFADGFSITNVSFVYAIIIVYEEYCVYDAANLGIISETTKFWSNECREMWKKWTQKCLASWGHGNAEVDPSSYLLGLVYDDGLVLRYEDLHDAPANEVGDGADAEDDHEAGWLAREAHELEDLTLTSSVVEKVLFLMVNG